jgi:hypothetical protein
MVRAAIACLREGSFGQVDRISEQMIVTYQAERDRWLRTQAPLRAVRVRALLDTSASTSSGPRAVRR